MSVKGVSQVRTTRYRLGTCKLHIKSSREGLTNPVIGPQPRCPVKEENFLGTKVIDASPQRCSDQANAKITPNDVGPVARLEVRPIATKVEMASFPPSHGPHAGQSEVVDGEVDRPGDQLMPDQDQ